MPPRHIVLLERGPFLVADEVELMRRHRINLLVTKNSGGEATAAKLTAARELDVPVVMIDRPSLPEGVTVVADVAGVLAGLAQSG